MRQQIQAPKISLSQQDKTFRNIYGIDLASKDDYFAVALMQLPTYNPEIHKEDLSAYLPRLRTLRRYHRTTYPKMDRMLRNELFRRFPPFYIVADYTAEKTFTDQLIETYTDEIIETVNFSLDSKKMLKEDGLNMMTQGFEFPNPEQLPDGPNMVQAKEWLRVLDNELRHEQIITTRSNKISFDHPEGGHNDLALAWELASHGCLRFMLNPISGTHIATSKRNKKPRKESIDSVDSLFPELNKTGVRVISTVGLDPKYSKKSFKRSLKF